MRWLFLLLVVLNIFYYVWHQQEAPPRAKEVVSLSLYKGNQQGIRLLSESRPRVVPGGGSAERAERQECIYIGGLSSEDLLQRVQRRLSDVDVQSLPATVGRDDSGEYVLKVAPQSSAATTEMALANLANEFNGLKFKKMRCEGLQPSDSLNRMAPAPQ